MSRRLTEALDLEAKSDNLNFIGALCLHQHRRDTAIGLLHVTTRQRGLLWYYQIKQKERDEKIATYIKAKTVLGLTKRIKAISRRAKRTEDTQKQKELILEASFLMAQVEKLQDG